MTSVVLKLNEVRLPSSLTAAITSSNFASGMRATMYADGPEPWNSALRLELSIRPLPEVIREDTSSTVFETSFTSSAISPFRIIACSAVTAVSE